MGTQLLRPCGAERETDLNADSLRRVFRPKDLALSEERRGDKDGVYDP
jgi:hypothetical protein